MEADTPTLGSVKKDLDRLREVAVEIFEEHGSNEGNGGWSLEDYLMGIDELEAAIDKAAFLPACSQERFKAEKDARNQIANELYYRGRVDVKTGKVGVFRKKVGEKGVHWSPTELSRQADRLANEPLRQIYKATEACINGRGLYLSPRAPDAPSQESGKEAEVISEPKNNRGRVLRSSPGGDAGDEHHLQNGQSHGEHPGRKDRSGRTGLRA